MQVLKDDIRRAIVRTAQAVFLERGFEESSMKEIASRAGVSVGNLYRYYPQKEALFEAVTLPAYAMLSALIGEHGAADAQLAGLREPGAMLEQLGTLLGGVLEQCREPLLILLYGSRGTKQEGVKEQLFEQLAAHVLEHMKSARHMTENGKDAAQPAVQFDAGAARPVAVAFLEGYLEIIRLHADPQRIQSLTRQYISLWFMGLRQLL
ncbi:TetR/AcrR family transcriptional regulator [Paenibacillus athensensis]|uniref:TetR/AcrR family transcriptional regulator n=1 Tax=Paenibacillus athensensis TaxID=1967502 RepID=UPI0014305C8B|nr:TetR/AcrR family transcriptional regulator [Paenibacillus athensensis]MCD1259584.1 TetR/AcrR family transcriptional regulator [Paenibacillus athensensis]